jgi:L-cysteine desulfidase
MELHDKNKYQAYIDILEEELVPALGCTEPIAIAYASAKAREILGEFPDKIVVQCSGNIIKNAKSVLVPNTGNLKGIKASALAGIVGGDASKKMQVLETVSSDDVKKIKELLETELCQVEILKDNANLHIIVFVSCGEENALVEIIHAHTNITKIMKNDQVLYQDENANNSSKASFTDRTILNIEDIYKFANTFKIEDIKSILDKQIECNLKIAHEGLNNKYGVNIGKTILDCYGDNVYSKMRAYAAAGSDARMSGCSLPVVTNSGSGNQGMTLSLPILVYAKEKNISQEKTYRALALANLIAIHLKAGIGRLSAYCGAVSAACSSGAAITYLEGGSLEQVEKTITNALANVSGIVCDGAKASCAAKIASSLDAAIMAHFLAMRNLAFEDGDGIVKENIESTISAVGRLGRVGMKETDTEVLNIMLDK